MTVRGAYLRLAVQAQRRICLLVAVGGGNGVTEQQTRASKQQALRTFHSPHIFFSQAFCLPLASRRQGGEIHDQVV